MKKLLYLIFFCNSLFAISQNTNQSWIDEKPKVILPSPQSQIFEKYLNHEIAEYNGLPEISIPLYEIEIKGLKIPVTLNYNASGIKYKQFDGDVGAGWSLSIGGYRAFRTIRGLPDELYARISSDIYLQKVALFNQGNNITSTDINRNFFSKIAGPPVIINSDSECDQFSYILPSTSGHFILDNMQKPVTYEANQDVVKSGGKDSNSGFTDMSVIDKAGIKYLLGGNGIVEKSEIKGSAVFFFNVGWPLLRIETPYKENINFQYSYSKKTIYPDNFPLNGAYAVWGDHAGSGTLYRAEDGAGFPYSGSILKPSISSPSHDFDNNMFFLNLLTVNNTDTILITRGGANNYSYAIHSIQIRTNGQLLKEVTFEYDVPNSLSWHLLLRKIKIGKQNNVLQEYAFDYYPGPSTGIWIPLPDQYGFYGKSSVNNNIDFRQTAFLDQNFVGEMIYDAYANIKVGETPSAKFYDKGFTKVANYYMLKRITFPTKGYTEYEYDADTGYSGPRVKRIVSKTEENANPITTEYSYENPGSNISEGNLNPSTFYTFGGDEYVDARNGLNFRKVAQYFPNPVLPEISEYMRQYGRVIKKQYDVNGNTIGKTVSEYNIPQIYNIANFTYKALSPNENMINNFSKYGDYYVQRYKLGYKPTLKSQTFYDNNNQKKKEIQFQYQQMGSSTYTGFKVKRRVVVPLDLYEQHISQFSHGLYYLETGNDFLVSKKTTTYPEQGDPIKEEEYYTYNGYYQLAKTEQLNSTGRFLTKDYTYTWTYHPIWESMNIMSTVMKTVTSNQGVSGTTKEIETLLVKYPAVLTTQPSLLLPDSVVSTMNGIQKTLLTYNQYNLKEKILQYTESDGVPVTCIWGYGNKYPVAEIRNATYQNVLNALGGSSVVDRIANSLILSDGDKLIINNLRSALPNAMVSTYTYQPGVGVLTSTDPAGLTNYYEYDSYGRLTKIKDHDGNIIEDYNYHYKGQ